MKCVEGDRTFIRTVPDAARFKRLSEIHNAAVSAKFSDPKSAGIAGATYVAMATDQGPKFYQGGVPKTGEVTDLNQKVVEYGGFICIRCVKGDNGEWKAEYFLTGVQTTGHHGAVHFPSLSACQRPSRVVGTYHSHPPGKRAGSFSGPSILDHGVEEGNTKLLKSLIANAKNAEVPPQMLPFLKEHLKNGGTQGFLGSLGEGGKYLLYQYGPVDDDEVKLTENPQVLPKPQ